MIAMARIHEDAVKGTLDEAKAELERILASCRAHIAHVGMTNNVELRQYGPPYRFVRVNGTRHDGYVTDIHVIFETTSRSTCKEAERHLIEHARTLLGSFEESGMVLGNSRSGGAGRPTNTGPHVVYVALGG